MASRSPGGHSAVPKYLSDALYQAPGLTGLDRDICMCVARWTYGHRRKTNLPNGNRLGPARIARETSHTPDAVRKRIRILTEDDVLIQVSPERGRLAAAIKVQPDPRLWRNHVPDELLARWAKAGLERFEAAIAKTAICEPVDGSELIPDPGPADPPLSKEAKGEVRATPLLPPAVTSTTAGGCFLCGAPPWPPSGTALFGIRQTWCWECWLGVPRPVRDHIEHLHWLHGVYYQDPLDQDRIGTDFPEVERRILAAAAPPPPDRSTR